MASDQLVGLLFRFRRSRRFQGTPSPRRVEIACKYHKRLSYGYLLATTGVLQGWPDKAIPTASAGVLAFERRTPEPLPACGNLTGTRPEKLNHYLPSHFAIYLLFCKAKKQTKRAKNARWIASNGAKARWGLSVRGEASPGCAEEAVSVYYSWTAGALACAAGSYQGTCSTGTQLWPESKTGRS